MRTHHVYLIPGFFGFVNFGRLVYFHHVSEFLDLTLHELGIKAEIHRVRLSPTASLRRRAAQLLEYIAETAPPGSGPIHLIGHSTGGLDARLLVSPGSDLETEIPVEPLAERVRTVIGVNVPHHGTPLASLFTSIMGQKALQILSLATVEILRNGRLPLSVMARIGAALARMRLPGGKAEALLDHLQGELLGRMPSEERAPVSEFVAQIQRDQSLLPQLTPEGIDIFNATASDREGVRYGCIVSRARPPGLRAHWKLKLRLYAHATYELYRWLHFQTGFRRTWIPELTEPQRETLLSAFGELPSPRDSDGIIPTYSQLRGTLIHAAEADHLDVIGHFHGEDHNPPHHDWLATYSGFNRRRFESLWLSVSNFLAAP